MTPAYHIFREVLCLELHVAHAEFLNEVLTGVGRQHRRWVQASIGLTRPRSRFDRYRLVGIKDIQDLCTWGEGRGRGGEGRGGMREEVPFQRIIQRLLHTNWLQETHTARCAAHNTWARFMLC